MKKKTYVAPRITIIPIYMECPLLSRSPGDIDVGPGWDGPWDGKEVDFEEDDTSWGSVWEFDDHYQNDDLS